MKKALIFLMACVLCLAVACAASAESSASEHNTWDEVEETQIYQSLINEGCKADKDYVTGKVTGNLILSYLSPVTYTYKDLAGVEYTVVCTPETVEVAPAPNCAGAGTARIFCTRTVNGVADTLRHYHYVDLPKTPHTWIHTTNWDDNPSYIPILEEATCYKEGKVADNYCAVCGIPDASVFTVLNKLPHNMVYFTIVPADCKHLQPRHYGYNPDEIHHPTGTEKAEIAADIANGYGYRVAKCVNPNCGYVDADSTITIALADMSAAELKSFGLDANGHKWGSEDAYGNPCNVTKACSICGRKEQRTLDAAIGIVAEKLDNCYQRKVTYTCTRCNGTNPFHRFNTAEDKYYPWPDDWSDALNQKVIKELVEQLKANVATNNPDLFTNAPKSIILTYGQEPAAHQWADVRDVLTADELKVVYEDIGEKPYVAATCLTDGYYYMICKAEYDKDHAFVFGEKKVLTKLGHDFGAYSLYEEHTDGNHVWLHKCNRCGFTEETVAAENPDVTAANKKAAEEAKANEGKKNGLCLVDGKWGWYASDALTDYTGFQATDKGIFYFNKGILDTSVLGVKEYNGAKFLASDGKLRTDLNGVVVMGVQEAYWVAAGKIATDFTGIQPYGGSAFYFVNGKIDFTKTGTVNYGGQDYVVNYGEVSVN